MKKYLALFLITATLLSLTSCAGVKPEPTVTPSASASSEPTPTPSASSAESPSPSVSAAAAFLADEPAAPEIGKYLKQHASNLAPEDGDMLLERLLLAQLDITAVMNTRILDKPYLTALNETLGGVLNAAKIPDIADETVRSDFQMVADSLMTMVRYEETPVFEPDWAAFQAMKNTFGAQAGVMIEYQSRLQGRYYFGDPFNFDLMAADIVAVEAALKDMDKGFARRQLEYAYTVQVGRLLFGPEGSYFGMFMTGDAQIIGNLQKYAEQYANSNFGAVCKNLLGMQNDSDQVVSKFISDSLIFPPGDPRGMSEIKADVNGATVQILQISGIADPDVLNKINNALLNTATGFVKTGNDNQTVGCYISFVNDRYLGVNFSYSYRNESDTDHFSESYLMLDLKTGQSVSLDELFGKPFESYKDQLLKLMRGLDVPKDLKEPVSFMMNRNEMIITVPSATSDWPDYYSITWNGLRSLMDVSQLY